MTEVSMQLTPNGFGLRFHHLGLAVRTPDTAAVYLGGLGYVPGVAAFDPLQNVNLQMFHHAEMPDVEVIWPGGTASPVDVLVKQREGLVYHVCYLSADPAGSLAAMKAAGLKPITVAPAKPATLFDGVEVSFHNVLGVGLIEIIHAESIDPQ
jgi:hypothetical protein